MNQTTTTNLNTPIVTMEDLKKAATFIHKMEEKALPKGLSWFTKLMAKFGWHRKYEVLFFDKSKLTNFWEAPHF